MVLGVRVVALSVTVAAVAVTACASSSAHTRSTAHGTVDAMPSAENVKLWYNDPPPVVTGASTSGTGCDLITEAQVQALVGPAAEPISATQFVPISSGSFSVGHVCGIRTGAGAIGIELDDPTIWKTKPYYGGFPRSLPGHVDIALPGGYHLDIAVKTLPASLIPKVRTVLLANMIHTPGTIDALDK